ncbi:protein translocase subunit SecF [Candidatus Woesearchaeota archaeon]|nr:protein translocase subunit SecF [Candidatus Woesearchaeota archaeon]
MEHEEHKERKSKLSGLRNFYFKQYKKLLIVPFAILILAIAQIIFQIATTGDFIDKDVDLKGGISIQIRAEGQLDLNELDDYLSQKFPGADIKTQSLSVAGQQTDIIVKSTLDVNEDSLVEEIKNKLGDIEYSPSLVDSSFGASFFRSTFIALIVAFVLMGLLVFYYFRIPIPSIAVILSAFSDIIATIATLNILGIKLTPGGIAGLLMLIGYSVDTDILLSTRVLKRHEGTVFERIIGAMKTGLTMSATTLAAVIVALIFARAEIFKQIMTIMLIGLLFDLIMTWFQNAGLLRLYFEKKHKKTEEQEEKETHESDSQA